MIPLAFSQYRLRFNVEDPLVLPAAGGALWRSIFGASLRERLCVTGEHACADCDLYRECIYSYIMETPPDPRVGKLTKYPSAPHPYVIAPVAYPGNRFRTNDDLCVDLTIIGDANRYLVYLIQAFADAGIAGIGHDRACAVLQRVEQRPLPDTDWCIIGYRGKGLTPYEPVIPEPPPCPPAVTLTWLTPLRLISQGKLLTPNTFQVGALFASLLRRVSLLTAFHTSHTLDVDFAGLVAKGHAIQPSDSKLYTKKLVRYSARQNQPVRLDGLAGELTLTGKSFETLWPYLWLGQWLHVGKATTSGLGRYTLSY